MTAYKSFVFALSAALAGLGGALYVPQVGIINPSEFSPAASIEAVIWVAVGGRGTLLGPIIGALAVNASKTWLTSSLAELWLYVLGAMFVAVTLLLPHGPIGLVATVESRLRSRAPALPAPVAVRGSDD